MEKIKKREPARLVVELRSRTKLEALHAAVREKFPLFHSTAEWARAVLFREAGL